MSKYAAIATVLIALVKVTFAQGIRDSLFHIRQVEVSAERIFDKTGSGMKETSVDSMVLREKANATLSELLSENTTVFIKNHGRGALATASFRGTAPSHTRVTWNGMPLNSPMTGMVDFSLIPVYVIDEIDLKHGSASVADRSGGLGGAIRTGNRANWKEGFALSYVQGIGSFRTFDEYADAGWGNGKFQLKTRLYHSYSRNDYTFINRGIGNLDPVTGSMVHPLDTNDNADYTRYGLVQELYYRPDADNIVSVRYWGQRADRTIPRPTSYEGPDHSNLNSQDDADHTAVAGWKRYTDRSRLELRSGYSDKQVDYTLKNRVPGLGPVPAIHSTSRLKSSVNALSYARDLSDRFSMEFGLDAHYHEVATRDTVKNRGYAQNRTELSALVALHRNFAERVNISLLVRQDRIDGRFVPLIPLLGFDLRLLPDHDLLLKGTIARNYHQPSLNDLYWQPGGNPGLLPEQGISGEAGLEFRGVFRGQRVSSELTAFRSDIDNWIIWIPSYKGYWEPMNIRRVLSRGLEAHLSVRGGSGKFGYRVTGSYAFTRSVNYGDPMVWGDKSYGKQLAYVPLHSGNVYVNLSYKGFFVSYQHNSYSERFTTSSNDISRRNWLYPYFMNDVNLGKSFRIGESRFSLEIKIHNLFNESYHTVLYRPMPGRNYMGVFKLFL